MKNISKQYADLLEGKMSRDNFVRNCRQQFPQFVSPVTSLDDAIKILKSKRIIAEMIDFQDGSDMYGDPMKKGYDNNYDGYGLEDCPFKSGSTEANMWKDGWMEAETEKQMEHDEAPIDEDFNFVKKMKDFAGEKGFTFSARRPTDEEDEIGREYMRSQGKELGSIGVDRITGNINVMEPNGDFRAILSSDGEELSAYEMDIHEEINEATVRDLIKPLTSKLESMGYEVDVDPSFGFPLIEAFKTMPNGSILRMTVQPSEDEIQKKIGQPVVGETIDVEFNHWTREVVKRFFGLLKTKGDYDVKRLPDQAGRNIDLGTGMFDIPVEQSVTKVIDLLKKAEQKVSGGQTNNSLNEVDTKEAKADEAVKAEVKPKAPTTKKRKTLHIDIAHPYEYRLGIQQELNTLGEYTDEALEKAKVKVLKNLAKDANFYTTLLNAKTSPYEFKKTETDKPGMQAKADGYLKKEAKKDEKSNVKDTLGKKEAGKLKPKGIKIMPDKGVTGTTKTIKEGLEELKKKVINKYVTVDVEDDGEEYPMLNKTAVANYLKSVIDPSEIKSVNVFMRDDEGFNESASYFFEDEYVDTTEQEVEDWAKQEMSYYLFSSPDEFPSKEDTMEEGSFMGGVDLGSSFDKMKQDIVGNKEDFELSDENTFEDLMKKYDWYYEMSDDPRAYDKGTALDKQLKSLSKSIGIDRAVELFNQYAPSDRKVATSFFQMNEDKHAKLKAKLKELLNATDLQNSKAKGQTLNISKSSNTDIEAAKKAKANFTTYE
jgi:ribosome modulation factor